MGALAPLLTNTICCTTARPLLGSSLGWIACASPWLAPYRAHPLMDRSTPAVSPPLASLSVSPQASAVAAPLPGRRPASSQQNHLFTGRFENCWSAASCWLCPTRARAPGRRASAQRSVGYGTGSCAMPVSMCSGENRWIARASAASADF